MTAYTSGPDAGATFSVNRLESFVETARFDRPTLVMDRSAVLARYDALAEGLGRARIHYAVKANPHPEIIRALVQHGSRFDAAGRVEIELCLGQGARARDISFGNVIKKPADIAFAHSVGIDLFAVDATEELHKIATHAPGARVYIRLLVDNPEADWPLSRKFGCAPEMALDLMDEAKTLGLRPVGLSFHVGSQTRQAGAWGPVLDQVAHTWDAAQSAGHELTLLNLGGGFPAFYELPVDAPRDYAAQVMALVSERFGEVPELMAEPGRGLVAEAGHVVAEVLLVSRKSTHDAHRWVYLDVGRFSGLAETEGEAIRYAITTDKDGGAVGPCVLAGPTCDSADVMYEKRPVELPLALEAGDRVILRNCGAYTATYASVGFNGFPPLDVIVI